MPQPLIDIIHLKKHHHRHNGVFAKSEEPVRAVDGVDLQIFPGETVALIGESGSGKTTLASCLFRIVKPTAGKIYFKGEEVWTLEGENLQRFRRQAQFIFQDAEAALDPRQTIGSAVAEPVIAHGLLEKKSARDRACELLQQVGLSERHFHSLPKELSSGQRHRAVIARALALQPKFIAADEPFSSLDVLAKSRLLDLFLSLQQQFELTFLIISHDLALVQKWCDRVVMMHAGRLQPCAGFNPAQG
jgi:ABC-type glutathione transport system ATPase component